MTSAGGTLLRRITSFFIDILAIAMLVNFSFTLLAGPIIQEYIGYEEGMLGELVTESDEYTQQRQIYEDKLENDDSYTQEDYNEDIEALEAESEAIAQAAETIVELQQDGEAIREGDRPRDGVFPLVPLEGVHRGQHTDE